MSRSCHSPRRAWGSGKLTRTHGEGVPTHIADTAVRHAGMLTLLWHTPPTVHMHTKACMTCHGEGEFASRRAWPLTLSYWLSCAERVHTLPRPCRLHAPGTLPPLAAVHGSCGTACSVDGDAWQRHSCGIHQSATGRTRMHCIDSELARHVMALHTVGHAPPSTACSPLSPLGYPLSSPLERPSPSPHR